MLALIGTYKNGYVSFDKEINVSRSVKVIITFLEDIEPLSNEKLQFSDFSFSKTRELLKDFKGSFSDEVIKERRNEI